ncbi:MAG: YCF48-related protein [Myxococcota bacterium]|nr:YCF48-related protein [Myxococcota bacterium]
MKRIPLPVSLIGLVVAVSIGCHEFDIDFARGTGGDIILYDDLYSISVVNDQKAVAVGYYGAVYATADGGESWVQGTTDTLRSLYNVSMGDAQHGWAVGQRGLILRTEDGGRNWQRQPNRKEEEGTHLFAVSAIDKDTAIAVGEWGTRIRTTNGGKTWEDHSFTIDINHRMFVWLNPEQQEQVRSGENVYDDVTLNNVNCLRGTPNCWLIGEFGYLFYSDDAGETWQPSAIEGSTVLPIVPVAYNTLEVPAEAKPALTEFSMGIVDDLHLNVAIQAFASAEEIRVFGKAEDPSELFEILEARMQDIRTVIEDAGVDGSRVRLRAQPPWDFEDYLGDDPEFLQRYLDSRLAETGGMQVRVIQNPILFTVRFRDELNGLIAGLGGVVLRTHDGGRNWAYRTIDRKQAVFSVGSVAGGRAVAVGEKGLIRVSTDSGDSWREPSEGDFPTIFTFMRDVGFDADGRIGFIVGQTGQILRSTDSGIRWTQVLPPPEA